MMMIMRSSKRRKSRKCRGRRRRRRLKKRRIKKGTRYLDGKIFMLARPTSIRECSVRVA